MELTSIFSSYEQSETPMKHEDLLIARNKGSVAHMQTLSVKSQQWIWQEDCTGGTQAFTAQPTLREFITIIFSDWKNCDFHILTFKLERLCSLGSP